MSARADRNLLFGILAIQLEFVTRDALINAMHAWALEKHRSLAEILRDQGYLTTEELQHLSALVDIHLKRHGNDARRSLTALSSVDASVTNGLQSIGDADVQASLAAISNGRRDTGSTIDPSPKSGTRYDILRHHKNGGLGTVFVAQDTELHREVALKEIQPQHADDPESRARFLLEAEITGGLEHPGIVPVYGLGTYQDGRPFYAMRFIRGDSLKQAIRKHHQDHGPRGPDFDSFAFRQLLRRFVDICNAIAYAHSRGVLHRDLKPGNVMLGKYGETLIVDWGLAKPEFSSERERRTGPDEPTLRPHSNGHSSATVVGRAIGTPAYMSPEQAAGRIDELGPATDVYSLGATLYELLTGQPPFSDMYGNLLLEDVQSGRFPPPRRIVPGAPPALEAVCLRAMATAPADRYRHALDLSADIEHWLADEPTSAFAESWNTRAWRWARRHRSFVTGTAAIALTTVAALGIGFVIVRRERDEKEHAHRNAVVARDAESAARKQTGEVLDALTTEMVERLLQRRAGFGSEERAFLNRVLSFHEQLARHRGDSPAALVTRAAGSFRVGKIRHQLGDHAGAEMAYRDALTTFDRLIREQPAIVESRAGRAQCHGNLGLLLAATKRRSEAEAAYKSCIADLAEVVVAQPEQHTYRDLLATAQNNLGNFFRLAGQFQHAEVAHRDALAIRTKLVAERPLDTENRSGLADSHHNLGLVLCDMGRIEEGEAACREAITLRKRLVVDLPNAPDYRVKLSQVQNSLGNRLKDRSRFADAETAYREAVALSAQLAADFPAVPDYRATLADGHYSIGLLMEETHRNDAAEASHRDALVIRKRLVAELPAVLEYRSDLSHSHFCIGNLHYRNGRMQDAETEYRESLKLRDQLTAEAPNVPEYNSDLAAAHYNLAAVYRQTSRYGDSETSYRHALKIREKLVADVPSAPEYRSDLANTHGQLGSLLVNQDRYPDALPLFESALEVWEKLAAEFPSVATYQKEVAVTQTRLTFVLAKTGHHRRAEAVIERLAERVDATAESLYDAACVLVAAGTAVTEDRAVTERYARRAVELLRLAFSRGPLTGIDILTDPNLNPLRARPDFVALLWQLADSLPIKL